MKVLIINKSLHKGGAAIAAKRLFDALKGNGVDVKMLVEEGAVDISGEAEYIKCIANSKSRRWKAFFRFALERLYFLPHEKNKSVRYQFSPAKVGVDISRHPWVQEADIIHLHWINHGFLSLSGLQKLFALNKPIVWTMHDMWPFTGGCHYAGNCNRFTKACGNCPLLGSPQQDDLSAGNYQDKKNIWNQAHIHAVGCSQWMAKLAQKSGLMQQQQVSAIPNPIDTDVFKPLNKKECREAYGFPADKKLLLFGAANINDPRKGVKHLIQALSVLNHNHPHLRKEMELVVFGKCNEQLLNNLPYKWHNIAFLNDVHKIVRLYNCADAFVLPSLEDNLPNTVMESLACGVPVVAFNIGGVPQMVQSGTTGYLAKSKNNDDLAQGIYHILYENESEKLLRSAREFVIQNYSNKVIAQRYNALYTSLFNK
ncbi:Glycosyltransferase involved in cell wall bisynthesis [Saccharicrinis carchari]|uniref:Glycosyltransferase involved in cell wall bisynthesis n=1 Tax=Saccharicrinis carchari TaxID=1168039 RepID=A0A521CK63_SACCC|nr:glycosyltransferase family 4 protein [Saccharicrinis carchari]SMO59849.1 Glycosyltransferase involved in cell wall bisynthesis [Saccharicrinis carchari]